MSIRIIAADDEQAALKRIVRAIREAEPDAEVWGFTDPEELLAFVRAGNAKADVAFLDIEMFGLSGIEVAVQLKTISPATQIIFVTAYSKYALDAFSIHARGYLLKPVTTEEVKQEIDYIRQQEFHTHARIFVRTFGNFDVMVEGKPINFSRTKSKEILAYLIDRKGATVTKKELAAVVWESGVYDRNRQFQLQKLLSGMMKALRDAGADDIVRKGYNSFSVDPSRFECDYYRFLDMEAEAVNSFKGEYMVNYSWAEMTVGSLENYNKP